MRFLLSELYRKEEERTSTRWIRCSSDADTEKQSIEKQRRDAEKGRPVFTENKKNTVPGRFVPKTVLLRAPSGARTLDTLIKSQVLYQLS